MYGKVKVENAESNSHWMCQNGFVEWDLKIDKKVAFNVGYGAGKLFRRIQLFEMFWHAEGMKTEFSGEVNWNGEKYLVSPDTCYGYSDKNWGKDFTSPWVWLSSCNLESRITGEKLGDSVFDIGGGCPKIGPIPLGVSCYLHSGTKESVMSSTSRSFGPSPGQSSIPRKPIPI